MQIDMKPKDNKSATAKRSIKRGPRQNKVLALAIQEAVNSKDLFDAEDKYQLAGIMREKYKQPIGEINHLIEKAKRQKLYNWIVCEVGENEFLTVEQYGFVFNTALGLFPGYVSNATLSRYIAKAISENKMRESA